MKGRDKKERVIERERGGGPSDVNFCTLAKVSREIERTASKMKSLNLCV